MAFYNLLTVDTNVMVIQFCTNLYRLIYFLQSTTRSEEENIYSLSVLRTMARSVSLQVTGTNTGVLLDEPRSQMSPKFPTDKLLYYVAYGHTHTRLWRAVYE